MKNICITIHHEGTFAYNPLSYEYGDVDVVKNVNLGNCNYERLMKIVKECCLFPVHDMFFCAPKVDIGKHLKPLRNDYELANFVKLAYDNGCKVELYVEHHGYDVMEMAIRNRGEEDVEIPNIRLNDTFLNKLVDGKFISYKDFGAKVDTQSSSSRNVDDSYVDDRFKVKEGFSYPIHNPSLPWNEMAPLLGMKFKHPYQLKDCLINYRVANGYPLWYRINDYKNISVICGKNVKECRCSSQKGKQKVVEDIGTPIKLRDTSISPKTPKSPIATPNVDAAQKAEVLKNPKISYRQVMVANVREKFLINLWDYKDEILSTNLGSSVQLDVDTMDDGKTQFKRMYICLKGQHRKCLVGFAGVREVLSTTGRSQKQWVGIVKVQFNENVGKIWIGEMFATNNDVYCFKFKHENGMNFVLNNSPWMHGQLKEFASSLGKPLIMDDMTAQMCQYGKGRIGYARVLVEISASKEFKECVKVLYKDYTSVIVRSKKVKVEYSWKPTKCNHCNVFGHNFTMCKAGPKTKEELVKIQEETEKKKAIADNFVPVRNQGQKDKAMLEE
ncbi:60S ribosomal protein L34 [Tanacetum coccineum]